MSKEVTEREVDFDPDEEAQRPSLSDFLSLGLRESQRPPRPEPTAAEGAEPKSSAIEPRALEPTFEATAPLSDEMEGRAASLAAAGEQSAHPVEEAPYETPDESLSDEPDDPSSAHPTAVVSEDEHAESESDYVVPVAWFSRPRILGGLAALAVLTVAVLWWSSRGSKEVRPPALSPRISVPVAHEPLPPPPPAILPPAPSADTEVDELVSAQRLGGSPAPAESNAAPPASYGPNVARYPDLPTPVLIQLEKDQQESKPKKSK